MSQTAPGTTEEKVVINWDAAPATELMPPGIYNAKVVKVEQRIGQESQQPYLAWEFVVTQEGMPNRHCWTNTSLQPNALWKIRQILQRLGVEVPKSGQQELPLMQLVDLPCRVSIKHEMYNDAATERVADVLSPGAGTPSGVPF
jgi:hypothetical protein